MSPPVLLVSYFPCIHMYLTLFDIDISPFEITGTTGFIGSHVLVQALEAGYAVRAYVSEYWDPASRNVLNFALACLP